jgi:hypothetical protein
VALYVSIQEFKSQATDVEDVVLEAAQNATNSIHTVSAQIASVETILQPYSSQSFLTSLNSIENTLSEQANDVESKVLVNKKTYKHVVDIIEIVLILMTTVTFLLIIGGLGMGPVSSSSSPVPTLFPPFSCIASLFFCLLETVLLESGWW